MIRLRQTSSTRPKSGLAAAFFAVGCCFLATLSMTRVNAVELAQKPNVVLILADDLGDRSLSCFGGTVPTPNLDRLAREGMVFENAHAAPMCAPTRDEMFTGLSRARFRGRPGLETPFFTNLLQKQGYRTGMAGKWYAGSVFDPPRRGFDEACVMVNGYRHWAPDIMVFGSGGLFRELNQPPVEGRLNEWKIPLGGDVRHKATCLPERYADDVDVDFLCDFIERNKQQPFFAYYASKLPHVPQAPSPDGNREEIAVYRDGFASSHDRDLTKLQPFVTAEAKRRGVPMGSNTYRNDATHYLDKAVGRLLDHIDQEGLRNNTVVIFLSDNGNSGIDPLPEGASRLPGKKGDSREGGTRVPLLIRWPARIAAGSRCGNLVHVQDFLPTLVELAGGTIDAAKYDGRSFAPQLLGQRGDARAYFVGTGAHPNIWLDRVRGEVGDPELKEWKMVWVRGLRYKLYDDGRFYDLSIDLEEANRIPLGEGSVEAESARKELQAVLQRFTKSHEPIQ
jgi:arylsulfatase A